MARIRNREAERIARNQRVEAARAAGLPARVARGHAKAGEPTMREIRASARERGESVPAAIARVARGEDPVTRQAFGNRARDANTHITTIAGSTTYDTSKGQEAYRILKAAAAEGRDVAVVGTRKNNQGAPLTLDEYRPATDVLEELGEHGMGPRGGGIFAAIGAAVAANSRYSGDAGSAVVRVSIDVER